MKKINKIIIVGGGTSAWLSAAYLNYNLKNTQITIIDKEIGQPVGVGEGTILNFGPFLKYCGLEKKDWFNKINATYKSGILFKNWRKDGEDVWHGFYNNPKIYKDNTLLDLYTHNYDYDLKDISPLYDISMKNHIDTDELDRYAYHVDASQLTLFLQEFLNGKVEFIKSEVIDVNRKDDIVNTLTLKNGQILTANLFIDCTGWKNILKHIPLKVNLKNRLFCDTAVASRIPYLNKNEELKPYVISQAVEHGWIWIIPTQKRIGSGLVFNRSVTDPEEAKEYFKSFWKNHKIDKELWKENLKILDWTPYYKKNIWEGNTVSIGLSAGFIEPLESTGIGLIMEGICQLYGQIKDGHYNNESVLNYNSVLGDFFENCIDFINMHYTQVERSSKFWNYVKAYNTGPNELLELFKSYLLNENKSLKNTSIVNDFFVTDSWYTWMFQLGYKYKKRKLDITSQNCINLMHRYYTEIEKKRIDKKTSILHNSHITNNQNI
jgi:tryptophan halogenase